LDSHRLLPQPGRERRASPRYACDLRACYQARPASPSAPWRGCRVRDISSGGIALLVSRACTPGTVLEIDLEGCMFTFPVRVEQASRQADGSWLLGCSFGQEFGLTDADLRLFLGKFRAGSSHETQPEIHARPPLSGSSRRRGSAAAEHRRWLKAFCQALSGLPDPVWRPAKVRDLSDGGLSLALQPGFEPGSIIGVNLHHTGNGFSCTLRASVTHAAPEGDDRCRIDCAFLDEPTELLKCFPRKRRWK